VKKGVNIFGGPPNHDRGYLQELSSGQDHIPILSQRDDTETTALKPSIHHAAIHDARSREWHSENRSGQTDSGAAKTAKQDGDKHVLKKQQGV
jgi:hypothetical protein